MSFNFKSINIFPQRKHYIPTSITINTTTLINIFIPRDNLGVKKKMGELFKKKIVFKPELKKILADKWNEIKNQEKNANQKLKKLIKKKQDLPSNDNEKIIPENPNINNIFDKNILKSNDPCDKYVDNYINCDTNKIDDENDEDDSNFFIGKNTMFFSSTVELCKEFIWGTIFKTEKRFFKKQRKNKFVFDDSIQTDGFFATIRLIDVNDKIKKTEKKAKQNEGARKAKVANIVTVIQKQKNKNDKKKVKEEENNKNNEEYMKKKKELAEKYKLSEEKMLYEDLYDNINKIYIENEKIKATLTKKLNAFYLKNKDRNDILKMMLFDLREKRLKKNEKNITKEIKNLLNILKEKIDEMSREKEEFTYIEHLAKSDLEALLKETLIFIDPGRKSILTMLGNVNGKDIFLSYSHQRVKETKMNIHKKRRNKLRKKLGLLKLEKELSDYNSNSLNTKEYAEYVKAKNERLVMLLKGYTDILFRKLKFYSYINSQRSEDFLCNKIKKVYGNNPVLIFGDWRAPNLRGSVTPLLRLKKQLQNFRIYLIDEFRTSKLHHFTEEECGNLVVKEKEYYREIGEQKKEKKEKKLDEEMKKIIEEEKLNWLFKKEVKVKEKKEEIIKWKKINRKMKAKKREKIVKKRKQKKTKKKKKYKKRKKKEEKEKEIEEKEIEEEEKEEKFIYESEQKIQKGKADRRMKNKIIHFNTEKEILELNEITKSKQISEIKERKKSRKIHQVLTYTVSNETGCIGFINRDRNAVRNMKKIFYFVAKYGIQISYQRGQ
jgi:hypothetical protein